MTKPSKPRTCPKCDGDGEVAGYDAGGFRAMFTCRDCGGRGTLTKPKGNKK
jgi:DnaJ-class molecular chaperone